MKFCYPPPPSSFFAGLRGELISRIYPKDHFFSVFLFLLFYGAPESIFQLLIQYQGVTAGIEPPNIAVHTWRLNPLGNGRHTELRPSQ